MIDAEEVEGEEESLRVYAPLLLYLSDFFLVTITNNKLSALEKQ